MGWALFAIALTASSWRALSFTLTGLPVLVAAAVAIRWCANVERARLRPFAAVTGRYRESPGDRRHGPAQHSLAGSGHLA